MIINTSYSVLPYTCTLSSVARYVSGYFSVKYCKQTVKVLDFDDGHYNTRTTFLGGAIRPVILLFDQSTYTSI